MANSGSGWTFASKDPKLSTAVGFLEANPSSGNTVNSNAGHAFGRIGQGDELDTLPYTYQEEVLKATDEGVVINLSVFPESDATAIGSGKKITFDVKGNKWLTVNDVKPISVTSATLPESVGATKVFASILAGATVLSTLY